ncbi:hypothetical protein BJV82DRAFT_605076 [Fennellomyces sp. T-0311]|nr:hypothetical protein BJV82DRAFT_605076 [Fennellomyces sp. T-0311]
MIHKTHSTRVAFSTYAVLHDQSTFSVKVHANWRIHPTSSPWYPYFCSFL